MKAKVFYSTMIAFWILLSQHAYAENRWFWLQFVGSSKGKSIFSFELGSRLMAHYNFQRTYITPPAMLLGEVQVNMHFKAFGELYISYGKSIALTSSSAFSFGTKLPVLSITPDGPIGFFGGVNLLLVMDGTYYSVTPPILPETYTSSGIIFRLGIAFQWLLGRKGFYFDTTMAVSAISNNFFIVPFGGIGFHF